MSLMGSREEINSGLWSPQHQVKVGDCEVSSKKAFSFFFFWSCWNIQIDSYDSYARNSLLDCKCECSDREGDMKMVEWPNRYGSFLWTECYFLYSLFCVIPRFLNCLSWRFGTLSPLHKLFKRPMKMEQSVPKCRHIKFRRQEITRKKEYNIRNTARGGNKV